MSTRVELTPQPVPAAKDDPTKNDPWFYGCAM